MAKKTIVMQFEYEEAESKNVYEVFGHTAKSLAEDSKLLVDYMNSTEHKTKTSIFIKALEKGVLSPEHLMILAIMQWTSQTSMDRFSQILKDIFGGE